MSNETSMVQYGNMERFFFFFFTDSCLLLVQSYQLPPCRTCSLPFLSNERKHQRYALLAIREWIPPIDSSYKGPAMRKVLQFHYAIMNDAL